MNEWSLDALYLGYDTAFKQDLDVVTKLLKQYQLFGDSLSPTANQDTVLTYLQLDGDITNLFKKLMGYVQLRLATNTSDSESNNYIGQLSTLLSQTAKPSTQFSAWLFKHKDFLNQWCQENQTIAQHRFILEEMIHDHQFRLDENAEVIVSTMEINASNAWSNLQDYITSKSEAAFNGEPLTLTQLRNLAYSPDANVRKAAYETELQLYESIKDPVAFALNSIKGEVVQISKIRGYRDVMEKTLIDSRMSQASLDAMWLAIDEYLPIFRQYFQHKAKLLGHDNGLPWYDLFAPMGSSSKQYSIDEAKAYIINAFSGFSDELGQLATTAFDDNWVDFLPKKGKVGGAFCSNLTTIKQSRVLTNYGGTIGDIITLAHELGHAYHGYCIQDLPPLNTSYTMPVAETASTFCENIVLNEALKTANHDEKVMLIENSLQDLAQIIVDIYCRYQFESEVVKRRESEFLFADELSSIMLKAQKNTYGNGLDANYLHPYMWICKGHYYSANRNFYNFPYAFGGLFSLGLFAQYQQEKADFIPKYRNLLTATTTSSCEDVALLAGIDVTKPDFWKQSLELIKQRIDQFIDLTK